MNRNEKVDLLKGIAILLVLIGHAIQQTTRDFLNSSMVASAIYSFHMPLFFFLSGYIICEKSKKLDIEWLRKQIISLVLPIIIWKYIYVFIQVEVTGLRDIWSVFVQWIYDPRGNYWFLWSLFVCEVYFYLVKKIRNVNVKLQFGTDVLLIMLIFGVTHAFKINWGGLRDIYLYLLFYISGYYLHKLRLVSDVDVFIRRRCCRIKLMFPLFWLILFCLHNVIKGQYQTSILNGAIIQFIYRILIAYLGIAMCWVLSDYIYGKIRYLLSWIGKYTKEIYIIHTIIMPYFIVQSSVMISRIIKVIVSLGVSLFIAWIFRNSRVNLFLFGSFHPYRKHECTWK